MQRLMKNDILKVDWGELKWREGLKKGLYFDISCFLLDVDDVLSIHSLWYIGFYIPI